MKLEKTPAAQAHFDRITDGLDFSEDPTPTRVDTPVTVVDSDYDMFRDNSPIAATCDTENPEACEACD